MKPKKKRKLRNAEYYDIQSVLDELYEKSKSDCKFVDLISIIASEENIKLAYRNIKKNKGSKTHGTDGKTIADLEKWQTDTLIKHIRKKLAFYQPQAVRRVEIPKANGKTRPLGIPTIIDRLIQQCIYQVLEPIAEAKFHERNNGFRPNRSVEHAMAQVYKMIQTQHLYYVIDIDIKSFFDNVQHGKLLKQLWTLGIRDKRLLKIISVMLKAEVAGIGFPEKGTPQGGIISPLLANVVLNELDWWITSQWEAIPTRKEYRGKTLKSGTIDRSGYYRVLRQNSRLKECFIIRYADDFKIFCRYRNEASKLFKATKMWLKERLGLDISEEKSRIVNLKKNYSEFLGFKIKVHRKGMDRSGKTRYTVKSNVSEKALSKIKEKAKEQIKLIKTPKNLKEEALHINLYNLLVIGTHNYYCLATHVNKDFDKIAFHVRKKIYINLRQKLDKKGEFQYDYLKAKYGKSKEVRFIHGKTLVPIGYVQHKNPMDKKKCINKFTPKGRQEIHKTLECVNLKILHYLMRNPIPSRSIEYNDNRLSLYCAMQGKCAITGKILEIGEIHCHHKTPIKSGGTDKYENLLLISEDVHILLHATNSETIEKYFKKLCLDSKQRNKLNKYRQILGLAKI